MKAAQARVSIGAMIECLRRLFHNPVFVVGFTACLTALVVQSGELGTSDTTHRLETTHSFWTSDPPVDPQNYPEFGIHGRNGKLYAWYGIGQSLLMLPADIVGTYVENRSIFNTYDDDPRPRSIVVSYSTNTIVCVLTILVCYRLLGLLGFTTNQRIAGALALLFCTTFLHYVQNMMENNYILLLTLTGLCFQYQWLRTGGRRALLVGSGALGLNLLTRLTTAMDLLAVALFNLLALSLSGASKRELRARFALYARIALPVYVLFFALDRAYQYARFGSFFTTYLQIFGREQKMLHPELPAAFPFETPFHVGFFGALFKPEKSIFLFDPLLILTLLLATFAWRRFQPEIRAYLVAFAALTLAYISFYARYTDWAGDFAWGDRYVSTSSEMVAFLSVPLLMRHRTDVGEAIWRWGLALVGISVVVQLASVMFWCPLEIYQMETLGHPTFVIALRLKNIVAFALGKMDQWGLNNDAMKQDPWDYVHITTYNFLPFLLARVGKAADWLVDLLTAIWFTLLGATLVLLHFIRRCAKRGQWETVSPGI
ncbi:MAG TPA: hypothetical protein VEJ45_09015 [Candidatus Acidoferrales bacterium]|nr:hypothetical protein [Candidatus Acidoferrales bacterium]